LNLRMMLTALDLSLKVGAGVLIGVYIAQNYGTLSLYVLVFLLYFSFSFSLVSRLAWVGVGLEWVGVGLTCVLYVVSLYHFLCFYVLESLSCWWGKDGYLDVVLLML